MKGTGPPAVVHVVCSSQNAASSWSLECVYLSTADMTEDRLITNALNCYGDLLLFFNRIFHFAPISRPEVRFGFSSAGEVNTVDRLLNKGCSTALGLVQ